MADQHWEVLDVAARCEINWYKRIGKGGYGTKIFQGKFGGKPAAIKKIPQYLNKLYEQEIQLFKENHFTHPNVITYYHSYSWKNANYIVMELCVCNLTEYVEHHREVTTNIKKSILLQTTRGLNYLHSKNIVHRDVKPDNILFSHPDESGNVRMKVSDYGISRQMGPQTHFTTTGLGTFFWGAPEMLSEQSHFSLKSDVFSLGNVFYYVLSWGDRLFSDIKSWIDSVPKFNEKKFPIDRMERNVVDNMIQKLAKDRPTTNFILKHPFFWTVDKNINFFIQLSIILASFNKDDAQTQIGPKTFAQTLAMAVQENSHEIYGANWIQKIGADASIIEMNKNRGKKNQMDGSSIVDLVRLIRNKAEHYDQLTSEEKNCFGSYPKRFSQYWNEKFPKLVLHLWHKVNSLDMLKNDEAFANLSPFFEETNEMGDIEGKDLNFQQMMTTDSNKIGDDKVFLKAVVTGTINQWSSKDGVQSVEVWLDDDLLSSHGDLLFTKMKTSLLGINEQGLLHLAAQWDSPELVQRITKQNQHIDINKCDLDGNTPLHIAALHNSLRAAKTLIEEASMIRKYVEMNARNLEGFTPLHLCCTKNSKEMADYLIENRADVNATNKNIETPLHICAKENNPEIAEMLIAKRAQVDSVNYYGETALHLCSVKDSVQVAEILLNCEADANAVDRRGETVLHSCCKTNSWKVVQLLLSNNNGNQIDVNLRNIWGKTALHLSCIHQKMETTNLLLLHASTQENPLQIVDQQNRLPIHYCAINDFDPMENLRKHLKAKEIVGDLNDLHQKLQDITSLLGNQLESEDELDKKLNDIERLIESQLESRDNFEWTPIHYCAMNDSHRFAKLLAHHPKSMCNAKNKSRENWLHISSCFNSFKVVEKLLPHKRNENCNECFNAIAYNYIIIGLLRTLTPLYFCAEYNSKEVAELLVEKGTSVNTADFRDRTLLHFCAENNSKEVAELLVEKGASVNATDVENRTPLHWCGIRNSKEVSELLLEKGASVNATDVENRTPLHWCAEFNSKDVAELLVEKGAINNGIFDPERKELIKKTKN